MMSSTLLLIQLLNLILLLGYPVLTLIALFELRRRNLSGILQALWVLITLFPYLGPLAFWLLSPKQEE
jgi:hypothetical protein